MHSSKACRIWIRSWFSSVVSFLQDFSNRNMKGNIVMARAFPTEKKRVQNLLTIIFPFICTIIHKDFRSLIRQMYLIFN